MTKLQELKEAIIKIVPSIESSRERRPITLADCLIALGSNKNFTIETAFYVNFYGEFVDFETKNIGVEWNLKENLDNQEPETINLLHSIIYKQ